MMTQKSPGAWNSTGTFFFPQPEIIADLNSSLRGLVFSGIEMQEKPRST
jgi:hypothetical protein